MELSIKTKGQGADDQEISIRLPVETLKMLQESLVQPKNSTASPASQHGSFRREASPLRGGFGASTSNPNDRYGAYSPMRNFGEKASSTLSGSTFRPSHRECTPRAEAFEDEDEGKERRHLEIQSIIDRKVFTPKFWDVEGPAVLSDFGPKPGMTQDPFLRSVSFQGHNFGLPQAASPLNLSKNPTSKSSLSELGPDGLQPHSGRSGLHQQTFADSLQSQYGGNLPTFGRAFDDTLDKFDKDMQKIFKKAKNMKIETEVGDNNQMRVVMTPRNDEEVGDTFGDRSCEDRDSGAGSFADPKSRRTSLVFNKKEEAAHVLTSKPRKKYHDEDISETKKSAEKFLSKLLSGASSSDASQARGEEAQKPHALGAFNSKASHIESDIQAKKNSSVNEEDPNAVSHNLDSVSESSNVHFRPNRIQSPSRLSDKLEARFDASAQKRASKIADFQPLNFQQKTIEAYLTGTNEHESRAARAEHQAGLKLSFAADPLIAVRARDSFKKEFKKLAEEARDLPGTAPEVQDFGLLDSRRSARGREQAPRPFIDTVSPIKPFRFGGLGEDAHEKFAHLNLDISAVNNESMNELSHLTDAGLDTPVMKALSSIQGKIEELNNMMGRKTDTERLLEHQLPHDSSRDEKPDRSFAPPGDNFLNSDVKMPKWAFTRENQAQFDHSKVSINLHDSDMKLEDSTAKPAQKENVSPKHGFSPSPNARASHDPSRQLLDQLRISRELMENRRRRSAKSGKGSESLDTSS